MAHFELSKKAALAQYDKLMDCADTIAYSLKTNNEVGKLLETNTGCKFIAHNLVEMDIVKDKSRVWYFAQGWDEGEIKKAMESGSSCFVVDNEQDLDALMNFLEKTEANAKTKRSKISLLLRMRLKEHTVNTGKHFVYGFYSEQVNQLIPKLAKNPKINSLGIHMHRKTQNVSEWSLKDELEQSLSKEVLKIIKVVDIGGGLPGVYKNYRAGTLDGIVEKIKELKKWLNNQGINVAMEPGRFIAAPAAKLVANIKAVYNNNIILDCSIFNSAMDTFIAHIRLLVEGELEKAEGKPYVIKGCSPDSADIFRYRVYLKEPKVGDKIIFLNAGAYNFTTDFCSLPKLETVVE